MRKTTRITATNSEGYSAPIGLSADPVIFTVSDGALRVLLVKRSEEPGLGQLALPGGFVGESEEPAQTALRKLEEKTGMKPRHIYLEQLSTYAKPDRDARGWLPSIAHLALVPAELLPDQDSSEAGAEDAAWVPIGNLPKLAFDHSEMVRDGLDRLRGKLWYSNVAVGLLPPKFSIGEARAVYEAIAGQKYNASNFMRDIKRSGLIVETGEYGAGRKTQPGRAGQLYRFKSRRPDWGAGFGKKTRAEKTPGGKDN